MQKIKYIIKLLISYCLYYTGVLSLYRFIIIRNKLTVLMYHRVLPNELRKNSMSNDGIIVETPVFNNQIKYLKNNYNIISIEDLIDCIYNNKPLKKYSCLIYN